MTKIEWEDALILKGIRLARFFVKHIPVRLSFAIIRAVGRTIYRLSKRGRIAYRNVRMVFAAEGMSRRRMRAIARLSIENLASSAVDLLTIPDMDREYVRRHIKIQGTEKFEPLLKQGKGIIFLTAHFGSWEILNITGALLGYQMLALARTQKHPRSDAFLNGLRTSKGSQVVVKGFPVREILRALKNGKIVGILSDQDGGKNGTWVDLFGIRSSTPGGAATFSIRTGAPIFPVFIFREKDLNHRVEVEGPLEAVPSEATEEEAGAHLLQQYTAILESKIRKAPEQWLWAHRRWKSTPDRSVMVLGDGKAGHENQIEATLPIFEEERKKRAWASGRLTVRKVVVRYRFPLAKDILRAALWLFRKKLPWPAAWRTCLLDAECNRQLTASFADYVVSCGSSAAAVNLLASWENMARSLVLMRPGLPYGLFDAVVVPKHDKPDDRLKNVYVTEGALMAVSDDNIKTYATALSAELGLNGSHKKIGFLVGGDAGRLKFERKLFEKTLTALAKAAKEAGAYCLATASRRTPPWAEALLKEVLRDKNLCPLLVIPREKNRQGVVPGILGLSDVSVVSGESMSMVSEAVSCGKPVIVYMPYQARRMKKKHAALLKDWEQKRWLVTASAEQLSETVREHLLANRPVGACPVSRINREVLTEAVRKIF